MKKRTTYHHGDLRAALTNAGLAILDEGGIDALGLRAVARATGVSHAAPQRHFADLGALLEELATLIFGQLAEAMTEAETKHDNPARSFREIGLSYVSFAITYPERFRLLAHPAATNPDTAPEAQHIRSGPFDILVTAVQNVLSPSSSPDHIQTTALTAWAAVHGVAGLLIDNQAKSRGFTEEPLVIAGRVLDALFVDLER